MEIHSSLLTFLYIDYKLLFIPVQRTKNLY